MKNLLTLLLIVLLGLSACNNSIDVASTDLPDISQTNNHYIGNQAPLVNTPFIKLPIGSIEPAGWVRKQLELQADGYFGHLGEISQFLIKSSVLSELLYRAISVMQI